MGKLSKTEFDAYLKQIRALAEGPFEELQKEIEVTNVFPKEFYELGIKNDLYRCSVPVEFGGWGLSETEILRIQEEFSRGPGGIRMVFIWRRRQSGQRVRAPALHQPGRRRRWFLRHLRLQRRQAQHLPRQHHCPQHATLLPLRAGFVWWSKQKKD